MFQKVLIVDDHAAVNDGISHILSSAGVQQIDKALYCDEAYLKLKKAILDQKPFDLIITDLHFKKDHRERELTSGEELVVKIRSELNDLPIIIYSQEDHFQKVRAFVNSYAVNAYVCKSRDSHKDLSKALQEVFSGNLFLSSQIERALTEKNDNEINDFDLSLIRLLSEGKSQSQISRLLRNQGVQPSSISSIEKRLNRLKDQFLANNTVHLVSILKDHKFI